MKRSAVLLTFVILHSTPILATLSVPSDFSSIQMAIDSAVAGDTVLVADGVYAGEGNRDLDFGGKSIVLLSENGPEATVIDCAGSSVEFHRGVRFHGGEDTAAVLSGFTIRNGFGPRDGPSSRSVGGAVSCDSGSSPLIVNCVFAADTAWDGGAVYCYKSSPVFRDCRIEGNVGWNVGGGMTCNEATPSLMNCTIAGDSSYWGGGIYGMNSTINLIDCTIEANRANHGGGIETESSTVVATGSTFLDNRAIRGAAVYGGSVVAERSVFRNNIAEQSGSCFDNVQASLTNCTVLNNTSPNGLTFQTDITLNRCVVAYNYGPLSFSVTTPIMLCTDIYGNGKDDTLGVHADQLGVAGNISADPIFCDTSVNNYHLWYLSPCGPDSSGCGLMGAFEVGCDDRMPPVAGPIWFGDSDPSYPAVRTLTPLIAWHYIDTVESYQTQYQIQVGTDTDWTVAELWDTGPVQSSDTVTLYSGDPLQDRQRCYVRIRLGNESGWGSWVETYFLVRIPPQQAGPSDWPTFQYNNQHTGYNDKDNITTPLEMKWAKKYVGKPLAQLIAAGGRLYWTARYKWYDDRLYCLDANTGDSLWGELIYNGYIVPPTYYDGILFYQHENYASYPWVRACDAASGTLLWRSSYWGPGRRMLSPIVASGKVVIATGTARLYGIDIVDPDTYWGYLTGVCENSTAAEFHDTLYTCLPPTQVIALDLISGEQLWKEGSWVYENGPNNCAPVVDTLNRALYHYRFLRSMALAFDLKTRELIFSGNLPDDSVYEAQIEITERTRAPVLRDGVLYLVERGNLTAFEPTTADSLWSIGGYGFRYTPVGANGLIFASNDTLTCAIDIDTRRVVWSCDFGGELTVANNTLYIAAVDGWIYAFGQIATDVDDSTQPELPEQYTLSQNYPNPFNPTTTIEYSLPLRCDVELCIYNILGQKVKTLVSESQSAGEHTVEWDGTNGRGQHVSSGVYFYRLQTPEFTQAKKMVVVR